MPAANNQQCCFGRLLPTLLSINSDNWSHQTRGLPHLASGMLAGMLLPRLPAPCWSVRSGPAFCTERHSGLPRSPMSPDGDPAICPSTLFPITRRHGGGDCRCSTLPKPTQLLPATGTLRTILPPPRGAGRHYPRHVLPKLPPCSLLRYLALASLDTVYAL